MGGTSTERDVSIKTGNAVVQTCEAIGYEVIPLVLQEDIQPLIPELLAADLVFNALHGGIGENGVIQGFLEALGVRYTGSDALTSSLCMDKHLCKSIVRHHGFPTPNWVHVAPGEAFPGPGSIDYPVVVKPNDQGSTVGLSLVEAPDQMEEAVQFAQQFSPEVIIEDYIPGRELTATVIGGKVYPIVEIFPSHTYYDYECKYQEGLSEYQCPADLSAQQRELVNSITSGIYRLLKCRHYGRIDFRLDPEGNLWFLELNTLPGMTATSLVPKAAKADGVTFEDLITTIINEALQE
jgi:D-alanine-D-alanine ligase